MSTKTTGKRPLRTLSAHEKLDAIRRVHDGESKASVARDIGVPESTLRGWCKNEDKISYLSRQSTPENDESSPISEPKEKKSKVDDDQPYNLSVKVSTKLNSSFSPNGSSKNTATVSDSIANPKPFNLSQKDGVKTTTPMSERERNRAELARLSVELGLNRPEMFLNMNGTSSLTELTAGMNLLAQWNSLLQKNQTGKITAPADSSNSVVSSTDILSASTPIKTQQKSTKLPKIDKTPSSVDESVWYWLKNSPSLLGITPASDINSITSTGSAVNTSTTYSTSNPMSFSTIPTPLPASMPPSFETTDHHSSWFWKWYKQFASVYSQTAANQIPDKPILYQQLTKDKDASNSENLHLSDDKPMKNNTKVRAVLDSLLLNNNNVALRKQELVSDDPQTPTEALEHGEKFLKWLENCGDPSVTAMQIMQFRYLINNIKNNVEKRNGDTLHKNKVRRK